MKLVDHFVEGLTSPICLTWELTYACNLSCVHCLSSSGRRDPDELSTDEAKAVIDELQRMQVFYVNIGGGEPTVRPDFWELLDYAIGHDVGVKFSTNGIKLDRTRAAQLARVAPPRRRQAVHAREVAGVGELPGQADRGVQAVLELVDQAAADGARGRGGSGRQESGHASVLLSIICERARSASAFSYAGRWASVTPQAASVALALGWSASASTTATSVFDLRKESFRLPKW